MTTRKITAKPGTKIEYKIIKDGFDTVSNAIVLNENTPKQIQLAPSQEVYNSDIEYELDQTKPCSPIIDIVEDFHLPDDTIFPAEKYILAPLNQTYRIPGENEVPSVYNNNFSLIGNVKQFYNTLENFSTNNYVVLQNVFDSSLPWTVVFKFNFNTIDNGAKVLLGYNSSGLFKLAIYNKKLEFSVSTSTSDWNIGQIVGTRVFQTHKNYWIKVEFTGSAYNAYVSEDGLTYDLEGTIESSEAFVVPNQFVIGNGGWQFNEVFTGSIDLNETYIQVDGKMWWKPEYQNITGWYSTVGSRGVVFGGLAKYFSTGNYLTIDNPGVAGQEYEIHGKFYFTSANSTHCVYEISNSSWTGFNIAVVGNTFRLWCASASSYGATLTPNTNYWFKCICNSNGCTAYLSTDGVNYTETTSIPNCEFTSWRSSYLYLGIRGHNLTEDFPGLVLDMSEIKILVDGVEVINGSNYNKIGYWNDNGVLYGFTPNNYLNIRGTRKYTADELKSFEVVYDVTTGSSIAESGRLLQEDIRADSTIAPTIVEQTIDFAMFWYDGSTYSGVAAVKNPQINTHYLLKWTYDGTTIRGYSSTDEGQTWSEGENRIFKPYWNLQDFKVGSRDSGWTCVTNCKVNLNNTYIKINDELWWKGVAKDNFSMANCMAVGSIPVDISGNAYDFTLENYIRSLIPVKIGTEIFVDFVTGGSTSNLPNVVTVTDGSDTAGEIYIKDGNFVTWSHSASQDIIITPANLNTHYKAKMKITESSREIVIYDANDEVLKEISVPDVHSNLNSLFAVNFGNHNGTSNFSNRYFNGTINLVNSYIITDGVMYKMLNLSGEYLHGILDPSFIDEYTQEQLAKLYCVTLPNSQYLCLTKENVNDEKASYKQYITDITIPARDVVYTYDKNTETWISDTHDESDREQNSGEGEIEPADNIKYYAFDPDDNSFLTTANTNGGFNCNTDIFFSTNAEIGTHQVLYMLNPETGNMVAITNVEVSISADNIKVYPKGPHFFSAPVQANATRYETGDIFANKTPEASVTATLSSSGIPTM